MTSLALAFDILARDRGASATFNKVGDAAERTGKKGQKSGNLLKGSAGIIGKAFVAAGAAVAAAGIARKIGDIIEAGSGLQQALGGAEAVFKKSFGSVDKTAQGAADALGLSRRQYLEMATVLGAGLKNKGLKDFAAQTQNLVKIGADLAAQYGGSTSDAVDALASAMRGESDPIERYGISLNETAVNVELARKGLSKLKGPALEQAKAAARIAIVQKQSADAMGAFGRESDTLAGKQQRLAATWENIKEKLGTALLPVMNKALLGVQGLIDGFRDGEVSTDGFAGKMMELGAFIKNSVIPTIQRLWGWVSGSLFPALQKGANVILPALKQALSVVTGGVGEGTVSWKKIGEVITQKVIPFVAKMISYYLPVLALNIRSAIEVVKVLYGTFQTWRSVVGAVISFILKRFADMSSTWASVLRALGHVPGFEWATKAADKLDKVAGRANAVATAIDNIDRNVTIKVGFQQTGRITLPGGAKVNIGQRAQGGPTTTGRLYQVGDNKDGSWNNTTELFRPSGPGRVVNQDEMRKALGERGTSAADRFDLSEATMQRLVALFASVTLRPSIAVGAVDAAMGARL